MTTSTFPALGAALLAGVLVAAAAQAGTETGAITGRVRLDGTAPQRPVITMSADPACDRLFPNGRPSEMVIVDPAGGLANVLVYVKAGLPDDFQPPPPPAAAASIDQKGCAYVPHVLGVRVDQEVEIHNGDATLHDVNARSTVNPPFNAPMPVQNQVLRKAFRHPELPVKLKCDIHPWMSAYIGVFAHPFFAVTGADGSFSIPGLPVGDYTIEAWHESLAVRYAKVSVEADVSARLEFSFAGN